MKLRTRLTLAFLGCGLLPLIVAAVVSYNSASKGLETVQRHASDDLNEKVTAGLLAQRGLKQKQLEDYFRHIRDQVVTFSEDKMVIDATRRFTDAFAKYESEAGLSEEQDARIRRELQSYYTNDFARAYQAENEDRSPNAERLFQQLGVPAALLQYAYIYDNRYPPGSKDVLDRADGPEQYHAVHEEFHPTLRNFLNRFGYYDIFLVDSQTGHVIYSVYKELDFGTSLISGPWSQSGLAEAYRKAMELEDPNGYVFCDYRPYTPSLEAPASFIASPIFDGDERVGVLVFQMPSDRICAILAERDGLGETGETILVGPDYLMRSNSHRDPENHSLQASFRRPETGKVDTVATRAAIEKGESGMVVTTDYAGNETLICYGPVDVFGNTWCFNAKMDTSEAFASVAMMADAAGGARSTLIGWCIGVAVIASIIVAGVALPLSNRIARPIVAAADFAKQIATGDLSRRCQAQGKAEVGELIDAMNEMRNGLHSLVNMLQENAETLTSSAQSLSSTATQMASGSEETTRQSAAVASAAEEMSTNMNNAAASTEQMSANIKTVATAAEEMTATISEVASNAEKAASVANDAAKLAEVSNEKIATLGTAAHDIGKVIEVIQDIAEQTNLLALNATIEAARAGEAGKGFAVVATEVKELAKQTASATDDIRKRIEAIQGSTGETVDAIAQISEAIQEVNSVSRVIASSVEEQSITTKEIAQNVGQAAVAADTVSQGVAEAATASQDISRNIAGVDAAARDVTVGASRTQGASQDLNQLAQTLRQTLNHFRLGSAQRKGAGSARKSDTRFARGVPKAIVDSWNRVEGEELIDEFYQRFFDADSRIAPLFASTDMARQRRLLQDGITHALNFAAGDPGARSKVELLGSTHSIDQLNIDPDLYVVWEDVLIEVLERRDPKWTSELEALWRRQLQPAIDHMSAKFGSLELASV